MDVLLLILYALINITNTGIPVVNLELNSYTELPIVNITLPVKPIPYTIYAVNECNGKYISTFVVDKKLF